MKCREYRIWFLAEVWNRWNWINAPFFSKFCWLIKCLFILECLHKNCRIFWWNVIMSLHQLVILSNVTIPTWKRTAWFLAEVWNRWNWINAPFFQIFADSSIAYLFWNACIKIVEFSGEMALHLFINLPFCPMSPYLLRKAQLDSGDEIAETQ